MITSSYLHKKIIINSKSEKVIVSSTSCGSSLRHLEDLRHRSQIHLQASGEMPVVGIRLRNITGVDCFINVAVNVLATTEAIRRVICEEGNIEDDPTENNSGTVLRNIEDNWGNASNRGIISNDKRFVIRELSRLMKLRGESIGDTITLRKLLSQFLGIFGEIRQNDAGDALFSILECLPHIEKMFNVSLRYVRTCLDCRKAKVSEASEGFINLDSYTYEGT